MGRCKTCYQRMHTIRKQLKIHKTFEQIQSVLYRTSGWWSSSRLELLLGFIRTGGEPYCGLIKGINKSVTRDRCFIPLTSWNRMLIEVLPKLKDTPFSRQFADDGRYPTTPPTYISSDFPSLIIINIIIGLRLMGHPTEAQSKGLSKARKPEQRINFKLSLGRGESSRKCLRRASVFDSNNLFGYWTDYLSMPLETITIFWGM